MGAWIVSASGLIALATAFFLRRRLAAALVGLVLAAAGAGLGWGAMLVQPDSSAGEQLAAVVLLAVLIPAHVRIVFGPFGPQR